MKALSHNRLGLLAVLVATVLAPRPTAAGECPPVVLEISRANPSPSGDGQWVRFLTTPVQTPEAVSLVGEMVWFADGEEVGRDPLPLTPGSGTSYYALLVTDRIRLTEPEPQLVTITGRYEGTETWDGTMIQGCEAGDPVEVLIDPFVHTVQQEWVDPSRNVDWPVDLDLSSVSVVFGDPLSLSADWTAPDHDLDFLTGNLYYWDEQSVLAQPLYSQFGEDYSAFAEMHHLGLGTHDLEVDYLGFEGELYDSIPVEITRPTFQTKLVVTPSRWIASEGSDLTLRACVAKQSGFQDQDPTGEITVVSESMEFEETLFIEADGCTAFEIVELRQGSHAFEASYPGDAAFSESAAARTFDVVPARPQTPKQRNGLGGGALPVQVSILFDNPRGASLDNPPDVEPVRPSFHPQVAVRGDGGSGRRPTGAIELRLNGSVIGLQALGGSSLGTNGPSDGPPEPWLIPFGPYDLADGRYRLEAAYLGDDSFAPGLSDPVALQVRAGQYRGSNLLRGRVEERPFELVLRAYPSYPIVDEPMLLEARLVPDLEQPLVPGHPSGTVVFRADGEELGRTAISGFSAQLRLLEALQPGEYEITAEYSGSWSPDAWRLSDGQELVVYQRASTTLATTVRPSATTGERVEFVAYVYDPSESDPSVPTGEVSFFDGFKPLGSSPVVDGQARFEWDSFEVDDEGDPIWICSPQNPTDCELLRHGVGSVPITAIYSGDSVFTPSLWTFAQELTAPSAELHVQYAMAQFAKLINSNGVDGALLEQRLQDDFELTLVRLEEGIESQGERVPVPGRMSMLDWFLGFLSGEDLEIDMPSVRSSFFLAKNDEVLVLVFRGTDGDPNTQANEIGEPGFWILPGVPYPIVAHPGWAHMANRLYEGFQPHNRGDFFEGIAELVQAHRDQDQALYIGGHSLGGALSRMLLMRLSVDQIAQPGDRIYTFGSPWQGAFSKMRCYPGLWDCEERPDPRDFVTAYSFIVNGQIGAPHSFAVEGDKDKVPPSPEDGVREGYLDATNLLPEVAQFVNSVYRFLSGGDVPFGDEIMEWLRENPDNVGNEALWRFLDGLDGVIGFFGGGDQVPEPPFVVPIGYRAVDSRPQVFDIQPQDTDDELFEYHDDTEYLRFTLDKLQEGDGKFYFPRGRNRELYNSGVRALKLRRLE